MLGKPPIRQGDQWQGQATDVPLKFMQHIKLRPLPITIGGSSNVTFTLNGGVTAPAVLWNGDDFIYLKTTLAYTWVTGSNNILDSSGAETTRTASVISVWYMYIDNDGDILLPSQTAPSYVETSFDTGVLGHPGTSRAKNWTYVGFQVCSTADLAFIAMTKTGYVYQMAPQSRNAISSFVSSSWNLVIPDLGKHGMTVAGDIGVTTSATAIINQVTVAGDSGGSSFGMIRVSSGTSSSADIVYIPFSDLTPASGGEIYSIATGTTNGTIAVTRIADVV